MHLSFNKNIKGGGCGGEDREGAGVITYADDCCNDDYRAPRESLAGSRRQSPDDFHEPNVSQNDGQNSQLTDDWRTVESNCCGSKCNRR